MHSHFILFLFLSPLQYDVVLEAAHVVEKDQKSPPEATPSIPNEILEKVVFQFKDIVYVKAKDCDIEFAARGGKIMGNF